MKMTLIQIKLQGADARLGIKFSKLCKKNHISGRAALKALVEKVVSGEIAFQHKEEVIHHTELIVGPPSKKKRKKYQKAKKEKPAKKADETK